MNYIAKFNGVKDFNCGQLKAEEFSMEDASQTTDATEAGESGKGRLDDDQDIAIEDSEAKTKQTHAAAQKEEKAIGFCSNKNLLINLILMTIFWTTSSFNYYIMTFYLKYIPGNLFVNTSLSSLSEVAAYLASGLIMQKLGVKLSFIISFILAAAGGIFLVIFFQAEGALIAVFVLFAKFGISFAFNISYLATPQMFPTALCSTAFGICNVFARFSTVLSPLIAELPDPAPMSIFSVMCIASAFLPLFLRKVNKAT